MRNASIQRVVMTRGQSLKVFGNPYGDDANMLMLSLNSLYRARRIISQDIYANVPHDELGAIDESIRDLIAYLEKHAQARPWEFNSVTGYAYTDLSINNWEGRFRNF